MIAFIPLAMLIALIFSAGGLWSAFQDSDVDLGGVLAQFLVITLFMTVLLNIVNRILAHYLAHPKIDLIAQGTERLANPNFVKVDATITPTEEPKMLNALESGPAQ